MSRKLKRRNKLPPMTPTAPVGRTAEMDLQFRVPLFPARARKSLVYYEPAVSLTGAAGVLAQYAFSANGVYDPNITGTGHQPLGFDTMMLYYEQYTVVASKVTAHATGNGNQAANFSVCLAPDTTTLVVPDLMENGLIKRVVVDGRGNTSYGTGQRIFSLSLDCDVAKYFGRPKGMSLLDDVNLYGTVAANPTEQVYYILNTWGFGGFADNTAVEIDVVIEYDVVFWEPRKVAAQLLKDKPSPPVVVRNMPERKTCK